MSKIGIVTTSYAGNGTFACNYGAALQGYALVKQLRVLGYDAYDINYNSVNTYNPQQYGMVKRTLKRLKLIFNPKIVRSKLKSYANKANDQMLRKMFVSFIRDNDLIYEGGRFFSLEDLEGISDSFYAFITGSDVVWNPYLHNNVNDDGFFLNFPKKGVRRIAYAPSLGVTSFPDSAKTNLKDLLLRFDSLSVREEVGSNLIFDLTGIRVPVVLDPTLLLEPKYYDEISRVPSNVPKEYILVYKFGNIEHTADMIKEIRDSLEVPVIYIPAGKYLPDEKPRYDLGPAEFVGLIKNAKIVLTDSFHCTVFCLINHTPFLSFYRSIPKDGKDLNSRIINLLDMVDMKERLVLPGERINYDTLFNIDFNYADITIKEKRQESLDYLKASLYEQ